MSQSKIVITGTIASGKSTLSSLLQNLGFEVISADEINRELIAKGGKNFEAIRNSGEFDDVFYKGELDKNKLASIIFSDREKMFKLNALTHPNILAEMDKRANESTADVIFIEIPLYYQMEEKYPADEVWMVVADYDTQLTRLMERDNIDIDYAKSKIETQEELRQMTEASDVVFDNSESIPELMKQVKIVLEEKGML